MEIMRFLVPVSCRNLRGGGSNVEIESTNLTSREIPDSTANLIRRTMSDKEGLTRISITYVMERFVPANEPPADTICYQLEAFGSGDPQLRYGIATLEDGVWSVTDPHPTIIMAGCEYGLEPCSNCLRRGNLRRAAWSCTPAEFEPE